MNQLGARIVIGEATFPSGIALLVDLGTLHLWQHTRPPVWPEAASDPAGDGLVDLGAARATGFMTTWGDGTFTACRDLDPQGRPVRVGVVFDDGEDDERSN